jgi:hypothetical protein
MNMQSQPYEGGTDFLFPGPEEARRYHEETSWVDGESSDAACVGHLVLELPAVASRFSSLKMGLVQSPGRAVWWSQVCTFAFCVDPLLRWKVRRPRNKLHGFASTFVCRVF